MSASDLTQDEFNELMAAEKHCGESRKFDYPKHGTKITISLHSNSPKEDFLLDISRSRVKISKHTFQNRARKVIILARLDIDSAPHRNPDGEEISGTHMHIYRPGMADKWAIPLPDNFNNAQDAISLLYNFMDYCKIITKPIITMQRELF